MAASYPSALKSFTDPTASSNLNSPPHAQQHIDVNAEITAIEQELGTVPKGAYASVKARLVAIEASIAALAFTFYVGVFTHDISLTGDVAYTGVGFQPTLLIMFAIGGSNRASWGFGNAATQMEIHDDNGSNYSGLGSYISDLTNGADHAYALIKSLDTDGFTLTYSKSSTPTGTGTYKYIAIKA